MLYNINNINNDNINDDIKNIIDENDINVQFKNIMKLYTIMNKKNELKNINENEKEINILTSTNIMNNLKIISKKVEIITKITYTYEDGSTKVVTQNETHEFK